MKETIGDLWRAREILSKLVKKDIRVQYKQTALGFLWVLFRPMMTVLVFATIFRYIVRFPAGETPYAIFVMCGIVPWLYFAEALRKGVTSIYDNSHIITCIYFPRIVLPIGVITAPLLDLMIGVCALLIMMSIYSIEPKAQLLSLPLFISLMYLFTLGVVLCFAPLQALYRDINIIFTFLLTIWMYLTPIIYPLDILPQKLQTLLAINPMTGIVQGIRWSVVGDNPLDWKNLIVATAITIITLIIGLYAFRRLETKFVDQV